MAIWLSDLAPILTQCCLQRWTIFLVPSIAAYMALVFSLRYRRARSLQERFNFSNRGSLCGMTTDEAQLILKDLTELEFPRIFGFSIIFALFKVINVSCATLSYEVF